MAASVGFGLALALIVPFLVRRWGPRAFLWLAAYPAACFAFFCFAPTASWSWPWAPELGVELAFRLDGLGRAFALMITLLGALILVFSAGYFRPKPNLGRFAGAFVAFLASMLGLVLSDDVIGLFTFWELTSVTSFLLIGFYHRDAEARASAQQALLVTGAGGLAMLAGLLLLGSSAGTYRISEMGPAAAGLPAFLLVLAGCAAKSAQFPFHFWLPNAMAAPTPVSAFLHSATMVKAGVFLLAKLRPVFEGLPVWTPALTLIGGATVAVAALLTFGQRDLKRMLALTTIGMLGMLTFLLGQPGGYAAQAFVALLVAHALYKGALFLVAGGLEHATGTRDAFALRGLWRSMPVTAAGAGLAALSALGILGTLGFLGKEFGVMAASDWAGWVILALFAVPAAAVATRVGIVPFWRGPATHPGAHEGAALWAGPLALGLLGVAAGFGVGVLGPWLLDPLALASGFAAPLDWHWFPGFGWPLWAGLALSLAGLGAGLAVRRELRLAGPSLDRAFRWLVAGLPRWCAVPSRLIQTGRLRDSFALLFVLVVLAAWSGVRLGGGVTLAPPADVPRPHEWAIVLMAIATTVAVIFSPGRISAICMLGIVGTGIAVLFLAFGAPDLAITQLMTELMTVVVAVLVFHRLPRFRRLSGGLTRVRDLAIALAFGTTMALLTLAAQSAVLKPEAARFFAERSVPEAHGRNVVNTILVDFRAMDTLGEITVLALAALGIFAMLRLRPQREAEA
jgi:multicomponent Na+:H+ antiporter subunit A